MRHYQLIQNYTICVRASDDAGNIATNFTNSFNRVDEGVYDNLVNTLRAGPSGDTIKGGLGGDTIIGSSGNDIIYPDLGASDSYITHLKNHSMVLWLDGSDPLGTGTPPSDGAHVATWDDKSNSNFNMPATSMPSYYSDGIGGRGAIRFDGVDDRYMIAYQPSLNATTQDVFVVAQIRGSAGTYRSQSSRLAIAEVTAEGYNFYASDDDKWELWSGNGSEHPWAPWN